MTDRELLERAARAMGWRLVSYSETGTSIVPGGTAVVVADGRTFGWRPLTDDGDSLRLAVALGMEVGCYRATGVSVATLIVPGSPGVIRCEEFHAHGPEAATRLAILRAAAARAPT